MANNPKPRIEIENIIKDLSIDRTRFFEVDKLTYRQIIDKTISKFIYCRDKFDFNLQRGYLRYNPKLRCIGIACQNHNEWWQWFRLLPQICPNNAEVVYIIFVGKDYSWVYEAFLPEIVEVLFQGSPIGDGDCYIISKKLEWLIGYSDDGDYITCVDDSAYFDFDSMKLIDKEIKVSLHTTEA